MRKICVMTGTRAEFGLLSPLMHLLKDDPAVKLQVIATGMHLSEQFGFTYKEIGKDGFTIDEKVDMKLNGDSPVNIAKSIGYGTIGFADAFNRLKPDILVLLGDRYEVLAAAQVAMVARIPIAHIHGGEATEGLTDEAIRHSVTKMAHLHFTAAEEYRNRVIQLGESPERVFNVGAPGVDNIVNMKLMERDEFLESVGMRQSDKFFLVTYHPVTLETASPKIAFGELLTALDKFKEVNILITKPNSDTGGQVIINMIDEYSASSGGRVMGHTSLGQLRYLSGLKYANVVIGNSSSGLIEAPTFKVPTINIGHRQDGRLKATSVIDCEDGATNIVNAIKNAMSDEFKKVVAEVESPYGSGGASKKIHDQLLSFNLEKILFKKFYNIKCV